MLPAAPIPDMLKIVVSAVNIVQGGILTILNDALAGLKQLKEERELDVTVLVHNKTLVAGYINDFTIIEYPDIKSSWIKRIKFEYIQSKAISKDIRPDLWIALHDITPNVDCPMQVVYCHNPSPFYKLDLKHFFDDVTFSLFCIFYKYLYKINIKKNRFVIVQQQWIREYFKKEYDVPSIVAYPVTESENNTGAPGAPSAVTQSDNYTFFYPTIPRTFKNLETLLSACRLLDESALNVTVIITMDGTENAYAGKLLSRFSDLKCVKFIGLQNRETIGQLYQQVNCLVFPSKLETWGLPVSEFKHYQKPIIIADLPYAHETIGDYEMVKFFNPHDEKQLARYMALAVQKKLLYNKNIFIEPEKPFFKNWIYLLTFLTNAAHEKSPGS